jgi:hypothetical protein
MTFQVAATAAFITLLATCTNVVVATQAVSSAAAHAGGANANLEDQSFSVRRRAMENVLTTNMNTNTYSTVQEDEASLERHNEMGIFGHQLFLNGHPAILNEDDEVVPFRFANHYNSHKGNNGHDQDHEQHRQLKKHLHKHDDDKESSTSTETGHHELTYLEELKQMQIARGVGAAGGASSSADTQEEDPAVIKKRHEHLMKIRDRPGIRANTVHAMMIDAGSTGSRMHVYEFAPRILEDRHQVDEAVAGNRLSFPGTESRWTDRLRPGINAFASIQDDDELHEALKEYLSPLLEFARTVLHSKQLSYGLFPIYLKATGGMRTVSPFDRQRLMRTIRDLLADDSFCPFWFEQEFARVIAGEEESIYGWAGTYSTSHFTLHYITMCIFGCVA